MKLDKLFYHFGYKISQHPILVILISLITMGLILSGLVFLDFEVRMLNNHRLILKNSGSLRTVRLTMSSNFLARNLANFSE
jgi:hypothetical protein